MNSGVVSSPREPFIARPGFSLASKPFLLGWSYSSAAEHLSSMRKALGLILSALKTNNNLLILL